MDDKRREMEERMRADVRKMEENVRTEMKKQGLKLKEELRASLENEVGEVKIERDAEVETLTNANMRWRHWKLKWRRNLINNNITLCLQYTILSLKLKSQS